MIFKLNEKNKVSDVYIQKLSLNNLFDVQDKT